MLEGIQGVSTYAADVDIAFAVVMSISLFLFIVTIGSMLYFAYKYRASNHSMEETKNIKHYTPIEIAWTVIPTILMIIIFYFGLDSLRVQRTMPKDSDAINIKVLAQRWSWTFEYENGKKSPELYIPINTNIKLIMTAPKTDVLHSFFVPAFRTKEDIVPGQITKVWFNINKKGKYDIQCAEYCGTRHSYMLSYVNVLSEQEYKSWIKPKEEKSAKDAMQLMQDYGCTACHSFDGSVLVGPSLKDIYNKKIKVLKEGQVIDIIRDDLYLKNALLRPNMEVVEGFSSDLMPSFKDVIKEEELQIIINYLKGKKEIEKYKINGKEVLQNSGCLGCHSLDGTKMIGPSFKNLYNRKTKINKNGNVLSIKADDKYIKNSILNPSKDIVEGYQNIMPAFENILSEEELDALIEYLKKLK